MIIDKLYGKADKEKEFNELLEFVYEHLKLGGGEVIRLGGERRSVMGYPHVVFSVGGVACAVWLIVGREMTVEEKNKCKAMGITWVCCVARSREDVVKFVSNIRMWKRVGRA
jgi:hypothetical protein